MTVHCFEALERKGRRFNNFVIIRGRSQNKVLYTRVRLKSLGIDNEKYEGQNKVVVGFDDELNYYSRDICPFDYKSQEKGFECFLDNKGYDTCKKRALIK